MQTLDEIENLVKIISKLPGLGPKSAKRIILKLVNNRSDILKPLSKYLQDFHNNIARCSDCGALKSSKNNCLNCENSKQKLNKICVVETIADQWSIDSSNVFKGYFHILGGTINAIKQNDKDDLLIDSLINRVKKNNIEEVILATSATVEGQTTAFYIKDSLKSLNVKITKLAQGLPIGGEIENLDDGTLFSAFKNRSDIN